MDAILATPAGASGQEDGLTPVGGDGMVAPRAEFLDGRDFPRLATLEKQGSNDNVDLDLGDEGGGGGVVSGKFVVQFFVWALGLARYELHFILHENVLLFSTALLREPFCGVLQLFLTNA